MSPKSTSSDTFDEIHQVVLGGISDNICAINLIPCNCVDCTSMLDKHWIFGIPSDKQERYQTVKKCTDWPV